MGVNPSIFLFFPVTFWQFCYIPDWHYWNWGVVMADFRSTVSDYSLGPRRVATLIRLVERRAWRVSTPPRSLSITDHSRFWHLQQQGSPLQNNLLMNLDADFSDWQLNSWNFTYNMLWCQCTETDEQNIPFFKKPIQLHPNQNIADDHDDITNLLIGYDIFTINQKLIFQIFVRLITHTWS